MSRSRILTSLAAASLGVALLGACSAESLTERAVGFGLEQAADGDQDIDIDFGGDGAGFSVSSDEGDFAINFDEESGAIVFETDEGDGAIIFDEENGSVVFETDEGDGSIIFDEENGSLVFETDEGDGVLNFDEEDGSVTFEGEDGSASFAGGTEVPAQWPAGVGIPQTADPDSTFFSVTEAGNGTTVSGIFSHSADEAYAVRTKLEFELQGWTVFADASSGDGSFIQFMKGASSATIVGDSTGTAVTITLVTS